MAKLMYYGDLRELAGCLEECTDAATMADILKELSRRHGSAARKAAQRSLITLDGVRVDRPNSKLPVPPDSVVCFFPLCSGG